MVKPRYNDLDAHGWFERADHFHYTAVFLMQQPQPMQFIYARPHIVMKAFAAEAYLKALLAVEGITPPKIHNLLSLFDKLKPASRKCITAWWNKHSKPILDKARAQPVPDYIPARNLRDALDEASSAFIDWRYHGNKAYMGFSILAFPHLVRNRILELKPDWSVAPPNPLSVLDPHPEFIESEYGGSANATSGAAILNPKAPTLKTASMILRRAYSKDGGTR